MSNKCTPLWREAHFEVKMHKAHHVRNTFWNWDVEKVHAVVARSTFQSQHVQNPSASDTLRSWDVEKVHTVVARSTCRSQNVQNTPSSDQFSKLRCRKSARCCGAKHISKSKVQKKNWGVRGTFLTFRCRFAWQARGIAILSKVSKTWRFCSISKNDGRRGIFEEDPCIFRGRRSTRDKFIRAVRRSGRWFPEGLHFGASDLQVCWDDFAWQVQHFVWPGITFSWQAQHFRQMEWKNRKTHWYEAVCSLHLNFPFLKEVWQNCFVFDVVNFKRWGSLADFLCFWRCQIQKLRKSRRIAAFLMLPSSKTEEVSQNSFVFKLADRQIDWETTTTAITTTSTTTLHYYYNYKCKYNTLHCTTLITQRYINYI